MLLRWAVIKSKPGAFRGRFVSSVDPEASCPPATLPPIGRPNRRINAQPSRWVAKICPDECGFVTGSPLHNADIDWKDCRYVSLYVQESAPARGKWTAASWMAPAVALVVRWCWWWWPFCSWGGRGVEGRPRSILSVTLCHREDGI